MLLMHDSFITSPSQCLIRSLYLANSNPQDFVVSHLAVACLSFAEYPAQNILFTHRGSTHVLIVIKSVGLMQIYHAVAETIPSYRVAPSPC